MSSRLNNVAVIEVVGLYSFRGSRQVKEMAAQGPGLRAADLYNADTTSSYGCGYGSNGIL